MKKIELKIDEMIIQLIEKEINVLIVPNLYSSVQLDNIVNIISYNISISEGHIITTNDLIEQYPSDLTQAYLSSLRKEVLSKKNQVLLIDIAAVDYKGFCKIYNLIRGLIPHIRTVAIFITLDIFANTFGLRKGNSLFLTDNQIYIKTNEDEMFFLAK